MARILMGVVRKKQTGMYTARKRVPPRLQAAVGKLSDPPRDRVAWLQKSLGTKDLSRANLLGKRVLMDFDKIIARAEASLAPPPMQADLSDREIEQIASYFFAEVLEEDEEARTHGLSDEKRPGIDPEFGLSARQMEEFTESRDGVLAASQQQLARGDTSTIQSEVERVLEDFGISLDRKSVAFRKLSMAMLREFVRAMKALQDRDKGEPIPTPKARMPPVQAAVAGSGETLTAALKGWEKARAPSPNTLQEFQYGIGRFVEFHGDMPVVKITRKHVAQYREALQDIPKRRSGKLLKASLPELVEWTKQHPTAQRLSAGTVNKLLGAVQTIGIWARDNGVIPDDVQWSDPFSNMRLDEKEPERAPWDVPELNTLFASPVFTAHKRPQAGGGEAAFWLPLLGLFTGARQGELGPLRTGDIATDATTDIVSISITEDATKNKRLKTRSSRRTVPVHPELARLGFLRFVDARREKDGQDAPLFPLLKPGPKGSVAESWSKWFGRYIRSIGINDSSRVFHSFRHSFKDGLRAAGVGEDINDALTGHSNASVGRSYGAKDSVRRFGLNRLAAAVAGVTYEGVKLP
ncbi:MAG TPA: site-specific integrase [Micropepsaceae bacterium]|jgi:integrase